MYAPRPPKKKVPLKNCVDKFPHFFLVCTMDNPKKRPRTEESPRDDYACRVLRPSFCIASLRELAYRTLLDQSFAEKADRLRCLPPRGKGPACGDLMRKLDRDILEALGIPIETWRSIRIRIFDYNVACPLYPGMGLRSSKERTFLAADERRYECPVGYPGSDFMLQSAGGSPVCRTCANVLSTEKIHDLRDVVMLRMHMCTPGLDPNDPKHLWIPLEVPSVRVSFFPALCVSGADRASTRMSDVALRIFRAGLVRAIQSGAWRPGSETVGPTLKIGRVAGHHVALPPGPWFTSVMTEAKHGRFTVRVYAVPPSNRILEERDPLVSEILANDLTVRLKSYQIWNVEQSSGVVFVDWDCLRQVEWSLPATSPKALLALAPFCDKQICKRIEWVYE